MKNNVISAYKKQSAVLILCMLLFLIPITFSGCQQKNDEGGLPLAGEQLSTIESLYGKGSSETLEALQLKESDISKGNHGLWNFEEPVSIEGKEFSKALLFEESTEKFYGVRFTNLSEDAGELSSYVENILEKANNVYGEPATYPGLQNRLSSEDFSSDFAESMDSGTVNNWREDWTVGEKTTFTVSVTVVEANTASISLEYVISQ